MLPLDADITVDHWLLHLVKNLLPITHSSVTFQTRSNKFIRQSELLFYSKAALYYHSFLYLTNLCVTRLVWVGCNPTQEVLNSQWEWEFLSLPLSEPLKTLESWCSWPSKPTGNAPLQSSVTLLVPVYFPYLQGTEHKYHTTQTQTFNQYLLHHSRTPTTETSF